MCGILGGNTKWGNFENGIKSLVHRGPDGTRIKRFDECTLAFSRLAVIDLSERAMQPMHSYDHSVWITYNGEIYGYSKLKKLLENKYPFYTESDTEVILNAYLEYGDKFVDYIDGMFAIALYDTRTHEIKLFRDRTGIKPLYYYYKDNDFVFASELKAIKSTLDEKMLKIDYTALYDYMFYEYIPCPKTMYCDCFKLPPASKLIYSLELNKVISCEKYWKLHVNTRSARKKSKNEINEALKYYIRKSVQQQMVADVPVGTYLSGGIDSSIITYHCHDIDNNITAYSIGFKDKRIDETKYAELFREKYDINYVNKLLDKEDISLLKGRMTKWYDEPFADVSAYPTYLLSKMARDNVTVVLTGDGSDELFGGYPSCKLLKRHDVNILKDKICNQVYSSLIKYKVDDIYIDKINELSGLALFSSTRCTIKSKERRKYAELWKIDKDYDVLWYLKKYYHCDLPPMTRCRYLDFKTYMPDDVLTKVDRVSMAVSLEARVPFLSREIIEFAFSLSEEECNSGLELKGVLKEAYKDIIPDEILYRKKQGFNIPQSYYGNLGKCNSVNVITNEWRM